MNEFRVSNQLPECVSNGWRYVLMGVILAMAGGALGQPTITYEDVAGWDGGRYAILRVKDWGEWPCFYSPQDTFHLTPGMTWDLREYPFNDTVEWSWDQPGPAQREAFPQASRIERAWGELLAPFTVLDSPEKELVHVFSLTSAGLFITGSQSRPLFVDSLFSRAYQWPDTVMQFPLDFGTEWRSHMYYGREPRQETPGRDSVLMESMWVDRATNSYGKFVSLSGDSISVLGLRQIIKLNYRHAISGDDYVVQHCYVWLSEDVGVVGWARVCPIDVATLYTYLDTTILRPETPLAWCGEHKNYLFEVAVRLPDSQQGLAPPTPNSGGRWAVIGTPACADNCDQRVLDITGRRVAATVGTSGVGVRVGPDGGLALVVR